MHNAYVYTRVMSHMYQLYVADINVFGPIKADFNCVLLISDLFLLLLFLEVHHHRTVQCVQKVSGQTVFVSTSSSLCSFMWYLKVLHLLWCLFNNYII